MDVISDHENATLATAREALSGINSVRVFGPDRSMGILSFAVGDVHPTLAQIVSRRELPLVAGPKGKAGATGSGSLFGKMFKKR